MGNSYSFYYYGFAISGGILSAVISSAASLIYRRRKQAFMANQKETSVKKFYNKQGTLTKVSFTLAACDLCFIAIPQVLKFHTP